MAPTYSEKRGTRLRALPDRLWTGCGTSLFTKGCTGRGVSGADVVGQAGVWPRPILRNGAPGCGRYPTGSGRGVAPAYSRRGARGGGLRRGCGWASWGVAPTYSEKRGTRLRALPDRLWTGCGTSLFTKGCTGRGHSTERCPALPVSEHVRSHRHLHSTLRSWLSNHINHEPRIRDLGSREPHCKIWHMRNGDRPPMGTRCFGSAQWQGGPTHACMPDSYLDSTGKRGVTDAVRLMCESFTHSCQI